MTIFFAYVLLLAWQNTSAASNDQTPELAQAKIAQQSFLSVSEDDREARLAELVQAVDRAAIALGMAVYSHPKWRPATAEHPTENSDQAKALYEQEQIDWRERWYGPIRDDFGSRQYLQSLARDPALESHEAPLACLLLADRPSVADLTAMLEGYSSLPTHHVHRISRARDLGWGLTRLPVDTEGYAEIRDQVFALFRSQMNSPCGFVSGCALDGLYYSGLATEAVQGLRDIVHSEVPVKEKLETVAASAQLLRVQPVDEDLVNRVVDLARSTAEAICAGAEEDLTLAKTISVEAMLLRNAVHILCEVRSDTQVDFLLQLYQSPNPARMLGLDAINDLGLALQEIRIQADAATAETIDQALLQYLLKTGERLWLLEEEPMTQEEYEEYYAHRDLRFTAAMYFRDLWPGIPELTRRLSGDPDAAEFLTAIARMDHTEKEGDGADSLYFHVSDKVETQLLCWGLVGAIERTQDDSGEVNVLAALIKLLADEVQADSAPHLAALEHQVQADEPITLAITVVKEPEDLWVKRRILRELRHWNVTSNQEQGVLHLTQTTADE